MTVRKERIGEADAKFSRGMRGCGGMVTSNERPGACSCVGASLCAASIYIEPEVQRDTPARDGSINCAVLDICVIARTTRNIFVEIQLGMLLLDREEEVRDRGRMNRFP